MRPDSPDDYAPGLGGVGTVGTLIPGAGTAGAPGALGTVGMPAEGGAGSALAPQLGHWSKVGSTSAPHLGHFTGPASREGGLKHMIFPFFFVPSLSGGGKFHGN